MILIRWRRCHSVLWYRLAKQLPICNWRQVLSRRLTSRWCSVYYLARLSHQLCVESFDYRASSQRLTMHGIFLGAVLMGVGGIFALGCNTGQAITGLATGSMWSILVTTVVFTVAMRCIAKSTSHRERLNKICMTRLDDDVVCILDLDAWRRCVVECYCRLSYVSL